MSCKICGRNSCTESFHSLEEQEKHENPEAYYEDIISKLETDKEALGSEVERMRGLLADKILDTRIKYNPEVVKARLTELIKLGITQAPPEGESDETK